MACCSNYFCQASDLDFSRQGGTNELTHRFGIQPRKVVCSKNIQDNSKERFHLFIYFKSLCPWSILNYYWSLPLSDRKITFFPLRFIYLFLADLDLHCWAQTFSSCDKWGLLFVVVPGLLIAVASLVAEHRLQACGLSSCGAWA